jgi:hypothetical protein
MLTSIETTGTITGNHSIIVDEDLPFNASSRVKVIVLFDEGVSDDIDEKEWASFLSHNEAFEFLADQGEDIYSIEDGEPV